MWAVAIGCFFRWKAFAILLVAMCMGVPTSFLIGRRVARFASTSARLNQAAPTALSYMLSLRKAVALRPVRLSFLLMWAPLPTAFCPFLVGYTVPRSELPLHKFALGAVPSKLVHFACDVFVGIEAGSLAEALGESPGRGGGGGGRWAPTIAIGTLVLTVALVLLMGFYVHEALHDIKAKSEVDLDGAMIAV